MSNEQEQIPIQPPHQAARDSMVHNTVELEEWMLSCVEHGRVRDIEDMIRQPTAGRAGTMASDTLRQQKNLIICTVSLVTRAAIKGGLNYETAFALSDHYIQTAELMSDMVELNRLNAQMVLDFVKRVDAEKCGIHNTRLVRKVRDYILSHIGENLSTEVLAKECGLNRTYLSKLFSEETGISPGQYVAKIKMEEAKRLMRVTQKSTAEIAEYLGYSSQSHFQRVFKKATGITPGEYRTNK